VTKLDTQGGVVYSKFLEGDGDDRGYAIAVDANGSAHVAGSTTSANFPVSADALQSHFEGGAADAFLTKLSPSGGTLEYSTYWGGAGEDSGNGIALDAVNAV
jgi:hypothetical protein